MRVQAEAQGPEQQVLLHDGLRQGGRMQEEDSRIQPQTLLLQETLIQKKNTFGLIKQS